jgi:hypothetical protein
MILINREISSSLRGLSDGSALIALHIRPLLPCDSASASHAMIAIAFEFTSVRKITWASISAMFFGSAIVGSFHTLAELVMQLVAQLHHTQPSAFFGVNSNA